MGVCFVIKGKFMDLSESTYIHAYTHTLMHIDIWHVNFVWILENQILSYLTCTEALPANFQHYKKPLFTMICVCTCGHVCMWCIYTIYIYTHLKKMHMYCLNISACLAQHNLNLVLQRNNWNTAQPIRSTELKSAFIVLLSLWCKDSGFLYYISDDQEGSGS